MLPCWSPSTWISMWRGSSMNFSMNTRRRRSCQPLALHALEAFAHVLLVPGQAHALAAAAGRGLHHHRIADVLGDLHRLVGRRDVAEIAGNDVDARLCASLLDSILSPIAAIALGGGPMKVIPAFSSALAKLSARTGSRSPGAPPPRPSPCRRRYQLGLEVGFGRRRRPEHCSRRRSPRAARACRRWSRPRPLDAHAPRREDHPARRMYLRLAIRIF